MQPGLRVNRTLKELILSECQMTNEGIRLLADALVGNTTMGMLDISNNLICNGQADIMRVLESTRLQTLLFHDNPMTSCTKDEVHSFLTILGKMGTIQELQMSWMLRRDHNDFAKFVCARNKSLSLAELLLAPPPSLRPQQRPHPHRPTPNGSTTSNMTKTMWMKKCHRAIVKFAANNDDVVPGGGKKAGSSAIFNLFRLRPALLEKRLKRLPTVAVATTAATTSGATSAVSHIDTSNSMSLTQASLSPLAAAK
jgi:hypothetical protein